MSEPQLAVHGRPARPAARSAGGRGPITVIKLGGSALVDNELKAAIARDVVRARDEGLRPLVVHGGGPQISAELARRGLANEFRAGLRVTTPGAMDVVRMVLVGQVQRELVGLINRDGPLAVGISGEDADTITAVRHRPEAGGEPVDIGRVGEIVKVDTALLEALLGQGFIPVVSPVARSAEDGLVHNVNADTAAAAIAAGLGARDLLMVTDVKGLYADWPHDDEIVSRLTAAELEALLPRLTSGMLPKAEGCLRALRGGVRSARIVDGRVPHAVLTGALTDEPLGTTVVSDGCSSRPREDRPPAGSAGEV
ncbi:acetylglutamate kinase [Streptomyces camelliae]|uniref:Acetylglutamate kinase n=1 Tax=Streptomyces camelliae TaxID=3004093 RepID=A0ABY7P3K4_9ACTN|nr:acetylglutamate kinase [Streptomyces sp. HUAS 2-6]WBO65109.1 acetylglutamate kinase [Streptomyces sp. HUAS 2-6]